MDSVFSTTIKSINSDLSIEKNNLIEIDFIQGVWKVIGVEIIVGIDIEFNRYEITQDINDNCNNIYIQPISIKKSIVFRKPLNIEYIEIEPNKIMLDEIELTSKIDIDKYYICDIGFNSFRRKQFISDDIVLDIYENEDSNKIEYFIGKKIDNSLITIF